MEFFPGSTDIFKFDGVFCNINLHILFMPYIYSRPYVYSFWQIFQALCLFPALRLFRTLDTKFTRIRSLPQLGFTPIFKGEEGVIFMATSAWSPGNKVLKWKPFGGSQCWCNHNWLKIFLKEETLYYRLFIFRRYIFSLSFANIWNQILPYSTAK